MPARYISVLFYNRILKVAKQTWSHSFIHSVGMYRMWWFIAVLRNFFHSSLLYNFSCHTSPPTILPFSLTSSCHLFLHLPLSLVSKFIYRIIHKSSRTSELGCPTTKTDTAESSISIGRESLQAFLCTRRHGVLAGFITRGQSWWNMAWTGNKKAFWILEFAKTESIMMVQRRFRTMYRTEPPTDKTIRKWHMKLQQSGCLCTVKQTGRPGPSAETVECVRETFVKFLICHQGWTYRAPVR
jgi:hypothetical protein